MLETFVTVFMVSQSGMKTLLYAIISSLETLWSKLNYFFF